MIKKYETIIIIGLVIKQWTESINIEMTENGFNGNYASFDRHAISICYRRPFLTHLTATAIFDNILDNCGPSKI